MPPIIVTSLVLVTLALTPTLAIQMDCFFEASKILCQCFGLDRDTNGFEDLGQLVSRFILDNGVVPNPYVRHIDIVECGRVSIIVNFRDFVIDFRPQNVTIVSFENVDEVQLDFQDIDYGNKQLVFKSVPIVRLTGRMDKYYTKVSVYVHNSAFLKGEVSFDNLQVWSTMQLINIQDARSVRVTNSYFYDVQAADILRADNCYLDGYVVECKQYDLFATWWFYSRRFYRHPVFIALMVILSIAIAVGIVAYLYLKYWRRRNTNQLELLGYPTSTISRSAGSGPQQQQQQHMMTSTTPSDRASYPPYHIQPPPSILSPSGPRLGVRTFDEYK